ncbi:uncharacterized protein LOC144913182 [Branchiostoma floridae x Branchiostoma belcheri]
MGLLGLLDPPGKGDTLGQFALGLSGSLGRLDLQEKRGPWGRLAVGLLDLQGHLDLWEDGGQGVHLALKDLKAHLVDQEAAHALLDRKYLQSVGPTKVVSKAIRSGMEHATKCFVHTWTPGPARETVVPSHKTLMPTPS